MKRLGAILIVTVLFVLSGNIGILSAQEAVGMGEARLSGEDSLIQSFLLICDGEALKYNLIGGSPNGLSYIELSVQDKIINHRECREMTECSMSGGVFLAALSSEVVTATVHDSKGLAQSEKIKITPVKGGTRVYFIGSVPGFGGKAPVVIASSEGNPVTEKAESVAATGSIPVPAPEAGSPEIGTREISIQTPGPEIKIDVTRNDDNDYTIKVTAVDNLGVDFIEILENGNYLDVEICGKKKECVMEKKLSGKNPGRNKYLIKSMNSGGAISFQEQLLYFTE